MNATCAYFIRMKLYVFATLMIVFSFQNTMKNLEKVVKDIKDAELELNVKDDVAGFLGVLLTKNEDGTITLKQTGLIQRILTAMGLKNCNSTRTPTQKAALPVGKGGKGFAEPYNYASVVGMLMYLTGNTRPGIIFAVYTRVLGAVITLQLSMAST